MATTFTVKRHDLLPVLRVVLQDDDSPVDLSLASEAKFIMSNRLGIKVEANMEIEDQEDEDLLGIVRYSWAEGDTDTVGTYKAEIQIMWPGQLPQTFPAGSYFTIKVVKDLDDAPEES